METFVAVYESHFVGSVLPHFNGGVQSLQLILQILLNTKTSWNWLSKSEADKLIESISRPVQQAYDSFEKAYTESANHKSIIDRAFEKSISVEGQLSNDARNSESKIQQQTTAIEVKSKQIQDAMDILQNTRAHLNSANGNVQAARDEYERRKRRKKRGLLGIRIPVIDDIVAELSGLNSAINCADDNVRHATEEVNRQAAVVQQREQELSTLQNELTKLKEENKDKKIEVKQQQEYISKLKKIEKEINTVRESLGKCTNYISTTFGKTKILRDEAKSLFSLEPLLNTIKDIEQQLKGSSGNIGVDGNTNLQLAKQSFFLLSEKAQNIRLLQNGHDRKIEEL
jgi:chromosome segregation ATPase